MIDKWKKQLVILRSLEEFLLVYEKHLITTAMIYSKRNLMSVLKLIKDYLQNRKQRTKIGSSDSDREDITSGVPQGSILVLLLFNIFLCDLFLEDENNYVESYAYDTTPYFVGS